MSNVLVRGIPPPIHRKIQRFAESQNLSVNQVFVQLIIEAAREMGKRRGKEQREKEAFRRIDEIREELYRQHGLFEDSAKLIREDRDRR